MAALNDERRKVVGYTEHQISVKVPNLSYLPAFHYWSSLEKSAGMKITMREPERYLDETRFRLVFTGEQKFTLFCLKYAHILNRDVRET